MPTTPAGARTGATSQTLRVVLTSGETISSTLIGNQAAAFRELDDLIDDLARDRYVRIGDDTIVRSDEVRIIQLTPDENEQAGLLGGRKPTIPGGDQMATAARKDPEQSGSSGQQPWLGHGQRPWAETKPFFMTSEFLAFALATAGVLIAAWIADNLDAPRAWLYASIITAAYIVSRGIAKAGTRDPNPDHRRGHGRG